MACWFLAELNVRDPEMYGHYVEAVSRIVPLYGGEHFIRSEKITSVAGGWQPGRIVLIRFRSADDARRCFTSPEYRAIEDLRKGSTESKAVMIED